MTSESTRRRAAALFLAGFFGIPQAYAQRAEEPPPGAPAVAGIPDARRAVERLAGSHLVLLVVAGDDLEEEDRAGGTSGGLHPAARGRDRRGEKRERRHRRFEASAVVLDEDGLAATAASVLAGAEHVLAEGPDGRLARCRILGVDRRSGVGALRLVPPIGRPAAIRPSAPEPGEPAVLLGNAFGFGRSVAVGWVSAAGRDVPGEGGPPLRDAVQLYMAVHPGDQGGPVGDLEGRLFGMLLGGWSAAGTAPGGGDVSFAVPARRVVEVARSLAELAQAAGGEREAGLPRVWLGIRARDLEEVLLRRALGLKKGGVVVEWVFAGSPAEKAGLEAQDVLVSLDGEAVGGIQHLRRLLRGKKAGEELTLRVLRGGRPLDLRVTLERP